MTHTPVIAAAPHDDALRALYEAEWQWRVDQYADIGGGDVLIEQGRPLFDRLPDESRGAQRERLAYWTTVAARLAAIDPALLSPAQQLNHLAYGIHIDTLIESKRWADYEMPVNSDTAFWSSVAAIGHRRLNCDADLENWIAQMRDVPRYFGEMTDLMRDGLTRGFTPPKSTMTDRDHSIQLIVDARPEDTPYFLPFRNSPGASPALSGLREKALHVIATEVQPAHAALLAFMRDVYLPGCRDTIAAHDLPDGEDYYRAKIRHHTTLDWSPADIHEFGLSEVAHLHTEIAAILKELDFGGSFAAFMDELRRDARFYARTEDELLMRASWIAKKFDGVAGKYFGLLPRGRFSILPVPREIAPYFTAGRGLPDTYLLNTYQLESRPLFNLPALTLHESAPGHSFQFSLAMENEALPDFRGRTYLPAYSEGWALYCERLGLEMGLYETPYERFGMLGYQAWRAARLVVDTGVHAFGWTRERAIAYLADHTSISAHETVSEVDRYISWPAQALSYYLGEDAIWKARHRAETALGRAFDLRAFHDTVLALGSVPLSAVDAATDQLIAATGRPIAA